MPEATQKLMEIGAEHDHHADPHAHAHEHDELAHDHDPSVSSVGIAVNGAVNLLAFHRWISQLRDDQADSLPHERCAGGPGPGPALCPAGGAQPGGVPCIDPVGQWNSRSSKIVFIGRDLDRAALNQGFAACLAG